MSMSAIIRAVAGGPKKTRAEGGKPEDDMEDDIPEEEAEKSAPQDDAEGGEPEDEAEGDVPDEDAEDEGTDDEMSVSGRAAFANGRKAERARIAAIMGSPSADANPKLAAHLAFMTSMGKTAALAALEAGGDTPSGKLAGKMAAANQPRLGGSATTGSEPKSAPERIQAAAAAIIEHKRAKSGR